MKPSPPKHSGPKSGAFPRALLAFGFLAILASIPTIQRASANDISTLVGGDENDWFFTDSTGAPANGYTVRLVVFDETQAEVVSLSYNREWLAANLSEFASGTTASQGTLPGPFAGSLIGNFTNASASFRGKQAWFVYSNGATLASAADFGVATSSNNTWTISNSSPFITTLDPTFLRSSEGGAVGFGSVTSTNATTGTIRVATAPATYLYWDADHPSAGGSGTWSTTSTVWSTAPGGVAGAGQYAWGDSGTGYSAGAGLTAYFGGTDGTVTVNGTVDAYNGLHFDPTSGNTYTLASGTVFLRGSSQAANTITAATGDTAIIASALTGNHGLTKAGAGTVRLDGNNSLLGGNVTVNEGTLRANATDAIAVAGDDRTAVNSGGSLLITHNNAVSGNITLAGGTLAMGGSGISDTVGLLTLSANSVIDLSNSAGARNLYFADSSAINWTGSSLQVWNWNGTNMYGTSYGDADRKIFFGNSASGLTEVQLGKISFYSDSGTSFIGNAFIRSTGEIAAIPEPEVYATAALLLLGLGIHLYHRRRQPAL